MVAKVVLLFLVVFLIASLMTNDVALWAAWSGLGDEEFYMVVAVVLYLHLFGYFFWSPSALALLLKDFKNSVSYLLVSRPSKVAAFLRLMSKAIKPLGA
jgi:hypothetical protein